MFRSQFELNRSCELAFSCEHSEVARGSRATSESLLLSSLRILFQFEKSVARVCAHTFASVWTIALFLERYSAHARDLSRILYCVSPRARARAQLQAELFARRALYVSMHPRCKKTYARVNAPVYAIGRETSSRYVILVKYRSIVVPCFSSLVCNFQLQLAAF